jgi:GxxExxY protein
MKHASLTEQIIGVFFDVYNELGSGFLESVYVKALSVALQQAGLLIRREMPLLVVFRGKTVGSFRADLLVNELVTLEVKACNRLQPLHEAQLLNYLRATDIEVGLLLNFGPRPQFRRFLLDNLLKGRWIPSRDRCGSIREHP